MVIPCKRFFRKKSRNPLGQSSVDSSLTGQSGRTVRGLAGTTRVFSGRSSRSSRGVRFENLHRRVGPPQVEQSGWRASVVRTGVRNVVVLSIKPWGARKTNFPGFAVRRRGAQGGATYGWFRAPELAVTSEDWECQALPLGSKAVKTANFLREPRPGGLAPLPGPCLARRGAPPGPPGAPHQHPATAASGQGSWARTRQESWAVVVRGLLCKI